MVATTLNDKVMEWGVANGYDHYNQAKDGIAFSTTSKDWAALKTAVVKEVVLK